ncbi:MAG TPA: YjgN family protein [Sphingomonadaceae bacterium]|nr:YjgN family protein [Sphingomonadaceae bacterium]
MIDDNGASAPEHSPPSSYDGVSPSDGGTAFRFTGTWTEYLPIALTNLALTIVTLGIYRFWATARTRRYLWSRTHFADDTLEWTGTGLEMFIGFLIVMAFLIPFLLFFQFGFQALLLRGHWALAIGGLVAFYVGLFYLIGLATFRALRYRLSRTYWHGIRGGSDDAGWGYAASALGKTLLSVLTLGLLVPWTMTRLWNERWSKMSFGPHPFRAAATQRGLIGRWLLLYLTPVIAIPLVAGLAFAVGPRGGMSEGGILVAFAVVLVLYLLILLVSLAYYAKFYRRAIGATALGPLDLAFTARSSDWLRLIGGTIALIVLTLGIGLIFVPYRNWSFFIRHLEATGDIDLDMLTQSTARGATDAEGLASAFDVGAI